MSNIICVCKSPPFRLRSRHLRRRFSEKNGYFISHQALSLLSPWQEPHFKISTPRNQKPLTFTSSPPPQIPANRRQTFHFTEIHHQPSICTAPEEDSQLSCRKDCNFTTRVTDFHGVYEGKACFGGSGSRK